MKNFSIFKTPRGFRRAEFRDANGRQCSIQESSVATEALLWLGVDCLDEQIVQHAKEEDQGLRTRMHLSPEMAEALIPLLQHFAKNGVLPDGEEARTARWS